MQFCEINIFQVMIFSLNIVYNKHEIIKPEKNASSITSARIILQRTTLSEIDFMHSTKESEKKTLNVPSVMENFSTMNKEKFGLSVSAALYRIREHRKYPLLL